MKHVQGNHYYVITVFLGLPGQEPELWEGPGEESEERSILVVLGVRLGPTGYPTALFSEKAKWSTHADCRWLIFYPFSPPFIKCLQFGSEGFSPIAFSGCQFA